MQTMQGLSAYAIDPARPAETDQYGLTYNLSTAYSEKIEFAGLELLPGTVQEQLKQFWRDCLYDEKEAAVLLIHAVQAAIDPAMSDEQMEEQIKRSRKTCTKMVAAIIESQINATVGYVRGLPEHERTPAVHYSAGLSTYVQGFLELTMEAVGTAAAEVLASPRNLGAVDVWLAKAVDGAYHGAWSKLI